MNDFELLLSTLLCVSIFAGPLAGHAIGVKRARTLDHESRRREWQRGYRQGMADAADIFDEMTREKMPTPLPENITRPMPLVPVSVDGDEHLPTPKLAADVRRPE